MPSVLQQAQEGATRCTAWACSCMPAIGCSSPLVLGLQISRTAARIPAAGEIFPQAVCQHHGLVIGAYSAWFVRLLMLATAPVSWPISKVLDYLLGEDNSVSPNL